MKAAVRVVLNTHVVLPAWVFRAAAAQRVRRAWPGGAVLPVASTATVQKLARVLAYPKCRLSKMKQAEWLADDLPCVETVRIPQPPRGRPDDRETQDLPFMRRAVAGKANVLVSGDRDLLSLAAGFEPRSSCPLGALALFAQATVSASAFQTTSTSAADVRSAA